MRECSPGNTKNKNEIIFAPEKCQNKQSEVEKWRVLRIKDKGASTLMVFFIYQRSEEKGGRRQKPLSFTTRVTLEKAGIPNTPSTSSTSQQI